MDNNKQRQQNQLLQRRKIVACGLPLSMMCQHCQLISIKAAGLYRQQPKTNKARQMRLCLMKRKSKHRRPHVIYYATELYCNNIGAVRIILWIVDKTSTSPTLVYHLTNGQVQKIAIHFVCKQRKSESMYSVHFVHTGHYHSVALMQATARSQ